MAVEEVQSESGDVSVSAGLSESADSLGVQRYPVAPGYRVNVRSGPGTNYRLIKVLPYGVRVPINCQKPGEWVSGPYGTSNLWDNIANGQFIADAYVNTGSDGYVTIRCS
ncbi:peptidase [Streptomyces lunaelactis]|uniref:peptidase n=1 Tax=Streptomyces lunaelactis TaxID=1535768 RepID=UPI0015853C73|nr:peptidase [Streptomyces lunaelactis]NUK06215.1 peptidase [Streptomyces lunaelactis]NUK12867.1 peptidase [Streptomyces lunaelactis]NUK20823.1 peptidase [Streptomyces lunaelactis]NUK28248.1 peptidase [Streptomyces lunaelactis]NUK38624.1 peptidase [Streptomyces lunaelactis]